MLIRIAAFFRPNALSLIIFLTLVLILPVVFVYTEPERTNYQPNEQQHWDIKFKLYDGLLDEYLFHTESSLDDLAGILHRDYVSNFIGLPLLIFYYLFASGVKNILAKKPAKYWS